MKKNIDQICELCKKEGFSPFLWFTYRRKYPKRSEAQLIKLIRREKKIMLLPPIPQEKYILANGIRWYPIDWNKRDRSRSLA